MVRNKLGQNKIKFTPPTEAEEGAEEPIEGEEVEAPKGTLTITVTDQSDIEDFSNRQALFDRDLLMMKKLMLLIIL